MFDATPVAYVQSNGKPRVDLDLNGLTIFIMKVPADATLPTAPSRPYIGLDHLGLRVDDVDAATAELKHRALGARGAQDHSAWGAHCVHSGPGSCAD